MASTWSDVLNVADRLEAFSVLAIIVRTLPGVVTGAGAPGRMQELLPWLA